MKVASLKINCIFSGICHLGESPVWNCSEKKLFWSDIYKKRIWVYDPTKKESEIFWHGDLMVGGFAFTKSSGIVLFTDKGVHLIEDYKNKTSINNPKLLYRLKFSNNEMFNDITVDPVGRILAGTLDRTNFKGKLYLFEKNKKIKILIKNIGCSNGMTFSLDTKQFFHTDSLARTITKYDYDLSTGNITNPKIFFYCSEDYGLPDGITMDSEGFIWAAFWGGSAIRRINETGKVIEEIILPVIQPSSVMLGGNDLKDLYITSSCQGAIDIEKGYDKHGRFLGGPVYKCNLSVSGRAEWLANF
jgi:sugar lactone lactonase YvrE